MVREFMPLRPWAHMTLRHDSHARVEDGHGRHEERYVTVVYDPEGLPPEWPDVRAVVYVGREREVGGKNASTAPASASSISRDSRINPECTRRSSDREIAVSRPTMPNGARSNSTCFSS